MATRPLAPRRLSRVQCRPGDYRRLVYGPTTLGSDPGFVWAYRQSGSTKVDILFYRGEDGFGVLAEGPPSDLATLRALARRVAESVIPRQKSTPEPEPQPANCDPSYEGECLNPDSPDYDCAGGSGDGPDHVEGPVTVVGDDALRSGPRRGRHRLRVIGTRRTAL
jgi:hypothetical protein